jgi:RNA polymerase sigma-70 factor (ECF subfamily)
MTFGGARARAAASSSEQDAAIEAFVTAHYARLTRLAWLVCRDEAEAADAVQAALERAWRKRRELRDPELLRRWLDTIVTREALRGGRRRSMWRLRTRPPTPAAEDGVEPVDREASFAPVWTELRAAFDRLPAEQRAVVALHLYAGHPIADTAAIVQAPVETVRSRLRLAKERLRRELEDDR